MIRTPKSTDVAFLSAVVFMAVIVAMLLASCGDDLRPAPPDAELDAASVDATPTGPDTWYHAYLAWEQIDCEHTRRCDPQTLEVLFDGSIPDCVEYLAQQDCNRLDPMHGPVNCTSTYPAARWTLIDACRAEVATLPCGLNPPASCEAAFAP